MLIKHLLLTAILVPMAECLMAQPAPQTPMPPQPPAGFDARTLATDLNVRTLQAQARELARRLETAAQQRRDLATQLSGATGNRIGEISARMVASDADLAQLQANLASVSAQLAAARSVDQVIQVPPPLGRPRATGFTGSQATAVLIVFTIAVLMPLSIAFARRLLRRPTRQDAPAPADPMLLARLDRLDQAVDAIAIEVERISEGQRFVTKVLAERGAALRGSSSGDASSSEPLRALGAGPIEQVRVSERQAVRQSVTPH